MTIYTPTTNFSAKDSLPSNDPNKVVKGAEFTDEFEAISTAFGGVAPTLDPVFTGTITFVGATGNNLTVDTLTTTGAAAVDSLAVTGSATANSLTTVGDVTASGLVVDTVTATGDVSAANVTATNLTLTGSISIPGETLATESYVDGEIATTTSYVDGQIVGAKNYTDTSIAAAVLAPITGLDALADVNVTNVQDGELIVWNATAGEWQPLAGTFSLDVDSSNVKAGRFVETVREVTYNASLAVLDLDLSNNFTLDFSGGANYLVTLTNTPALAAGEAFGFTLTVDSTNMASLSWDSMFKWASGVVPAIIPDTTTVLVFLSTDGGTTFKGFFSGEAFA
jgi:hypothetical protein